MYYNGVKRILKKKGKNIVGTTRKTTRKKSQGDLGGFTIIEVVLVLAIAGLIFLMVFIALPALQRSQRDTQRRNDLARLSTAVTQYQTNNNGRLPGKQDGTTTTCQPAGSTYKDLKDKASTSEACKFIMNYMNSANAQDADESEFVDPTGDPYVLKIGKFGATGMKTSLDNSDYTDKIVYFTTSSRCDGEQVVTSKNSRDYSILYKLEGSGVYCKDNGS